jgi:hypothetical protein
MQVVGIVRAAVMITVIAGLVIGAAHLGVAWVAHDSRPGVVAR